MVYVSSDGSVSNRRSIWRVIEDTISGFVEAIMLFFRAVFNPPSLQVRVARTIRVRASDSIVNQEAFLLGVV